MPVEVKICGITDEDAMDVAIEEGADYVGLVFFPPSPRNVTPDRAAELVEFAPGDVTKVGLFVDPDDATLDTVLTRVRLDLLQLHGHETPERVEAIRLEYGLPVMKVLSVSDAADLDAAEPYLAVADRLLFDAKPPKGAVLPGGNAVSFDWSILTGRKWGLPWMLAGGLTPANVAEAVRISGAAAVDVSSGVESAPGIKDSDKIRAFIKAARGGRP
ncbi:phosphoribosylanthranilate isomerase [Paramagnetospirillum magneticum]|uniref:N-(5'-phosphoribosyl)anthranilate isomerase n=1 Tax=Paramagnetospirillum magneticum (strain ATCC 700264 / AMB-1) TaxID=342108 RepID=TRPF_PARM1|nr:phosphoribosylanthranilate isomerase [Paramagnetospirillum magneticum]Q2W020.1 RecName: Full=N-(5'-phosphoribosyl)anthranilate isomerase; Short=PRAI [Paramagnetospirillum magneticum AMB-1]BAE52805.1 Phosphoribosylanthranilate isomerase [Paramagnetospirillum magneticum AMB-1]